MILDEPIKNLLNTNDNAEFSHYSFKVKILNRQSDIIPGVLVLVSHNVDNESMESCLLFIEESSLSSQQSKILQAVPVYSSLIIETAQSYSENTSDPIVTFSSGQRSIGVIFLDESALSKAIDEIEKKKSSAVSGKDKSYEWMKFYNIAQDHKHPLKSHSFPITTYSSNSTDTLKYVLPIQKSETLAKISLKRQRTLARLEQRLVGYKAAKEHYVNVQLMKNESEFVNWEKTTAFVGTWNVHEKLPDENIKTWLRGTLAIDDSTTVDPDFYVIGLQEIDTSLQSYVWYSPTIQNAWVAKILDSLNDEEENYYKVEVKQLVTIVLIVIAKKKHKPYISEVSSNYVGIGVLNMAGNKGGVGVRFRFHDSYLCFVTSHLAAFQNQVDKRNMDFASITQRLFFPIKVDKQKPYVGYISNYWNDGGDEGISFIERSKIRKDWTKEISVFHNDILIWCGDLNYRVDFLEQQEIIDKVNDNNIDELLQYDQLSIERSAGRTFQMFDEGKITFSPTYKYDTGTDRYDSEKKRSPSWTDRILWKRERSDASSQNVELLSYTNCMEMKLSDHKPVRGLFNLSIRHIDEKQQEKIRNDLVKKTIGQQKNQRQGQISSSFVDFGKVHFMEYKEREITLENSGDVVVAYRFLPNETTGIESPPWLQISPKAGVLAPNEKVIIRFEVLVDPTNSAPLNGEEQSIDEFLLLRVENFKDFYINVFGEYKPTCFGARLEDLQVYTSDLSASVDAKVPNQLKSIVDYLSNEKIYKTESLFLEHGRLDISSQIRKCLDNEEELKSKNLLRDSAEDINKRLTELTEEDTEISETTIALSMADTLVAFLACLPDPVVPVSMYQAAIKAAESNKVTDFIKTLPSLRRDVLLFIGSFLKRCIKEAPESVKKSREDKIVKLFTVLLHPPVDFKERNPVKAEKHREFFVSHLLSS